MLGTTDSSPIQSQSRALSAAGDWRKARRYAVVPAAATSVTPAV